MPTGFWVIAPAISPERMASFCSLPGIVTDHDDALGAGFRLIAFSTPMAEPSFAPKMPLIPDARSGSPW